MSEVIKRTRNSLANPLHLERVLRADTPKYFPPNSSDYIMTRGPPGFPTDDLSNVADVDERYWETVGDTVVAMSQAGQDAVDAKVLDDHNTAVEATIKARPTVTAPLAGITWSAVTSGLVITVNINTIVVDDETTVVPDGVLTKFVRMLYIHTLSTDVLSLQLFERTDGMYADVTADEDIKGDLGEWSVVASGTDLVEV